MHELFSILINEPLIGKANHLMEASLHTRFLNTALNLLIIISLLFPVFNSSPHPVQASTQAKPMDETAAEEASEFTFHLSNVLEMPAILGPQIPFGFNDRDITLSISKEQTERTKPTKLTKPTKPTESFPLYFVENVGQFDSKTRFSVINASFPIQFKSDGVWFTVTENTESKEKEDHSEEQNTNLGSETDLEVKEQNRVAVRYKFEGANPNVEIEGFTRLETKVSYLVGSDPNAWHADVPVWAGVRYKNLYPDTDLEITSVDGNWNWHLVVNSKEKHPEKVQLKIEGANRTQFTQNGYQAVTDFGEVNLPILSVKTESSIMELTEPVQSEDSALILPLDSVDSLTMTTSETLLLESDNPPMPRLFIYSTYFGSIGYDGFSAVSADNAGHLYATGNIESGQISGVSAELPGKYKTYQGGYSDAYIVKFSANGNTLDYFTYLGGSNQDKGYAITVDSEGDAYVTGGTLSNNFPVFPQETVSGSCAISLPCSDQGTTDGFVTKINSTGTDIIYSTYFGGASADEITDLTLVNGAILLTGWTESSDFPRKAGENRPFSGRSDVFVTKLSADGSGMVFSNLIGGSSYDHPRGIGVDQTGQVIVAGETSGYRYPSQPSDFPVIDGEPARGWDDIFISAYSPDGSTLNYSTIIGGMADEDPRDMKLGPDGGVFIAGSTSSDDFPATIGARHLEDAFVLKAYPDSRGIVYAARIGGTLNDFGRALGVTKTGEVFLLGEAGSDDFPTTGDAYQTPVPVGSNTDIFLLLLSANGRQILYSTSLNGDLNNYVGSVFVSGDNTAYFSGWTKSTNFPTTTNALQREKMGAAESADAFFIKLKFPIFPRNSSFSINLPKNASGDGRECPIGCEGENVQNHTGDPINTENGGFDYSYVDLSIGTAAGQLTFQRSYSSAAVTEYNQTFQSPLGAGWTHNHDIYLLSSNKTDEDKIIWFKGTTNNQYRFDKNDDGTFSPYAGVQASLTLEGDAYRLVDSAQNTYYFNEPEQSITYNENGTSITKTIRKLTYWESATGYKFEYQYNALRLSKVLEPTSGFYLEFHYPSAESWYLDHVNINGSSQNQVNFTIDQDDLRFVSVVVDPQKKWEYTYQSPSDHLLRSIKNQQGKLVLENTYLDGKVVDQKDGQGNLIAHVTYTDGVATIKTSANGQESKHIYDDRDTNTISTDVFGLDVNRGVDSNFQSVGTVDQLGRETKLLWSQNGANLEGVVDPLGNTTQMTYNEANNTLSSITDSNGNRTDYSYMNAGTGTLVRQINQYVVSQGTVRQTLTTTYEYTGIDPAIGCDETQPPNLIQKVIEPGQPTPIEIRFCYTLKGQLKWVEKNDLRTSYTYDSFGRVASVTGPEGLVNWTCYDAANRVIKSGISASALPSDPCADGFNPREDVDRVTTTQYDEVGNAIVVTAPNGIKTRTYYDDSGRITYLVQNLQNWGEGEETPPTVDLRNRVENITTQTIYDAAGQKIATVDPLGTITRTYYDAANRPIYVTQNLADPDPLQAPAYPTLQDLINLPEPPSYNPAYPDRNNTIRIIYDAVGNAIATVPMSANCAITDDGKGNLTASPDCRVRRSYYDALNRLVSVVENLSGQAITDSTPLAFGNQDQNIRTDTVYDAVGNTIASIVARGPGCAVTTDAQGNISANADCFVTRTYYDALNRPGFVVQNLIGKPINEAAYNVDGVFTLGNLASNQQQNLITQTVYDDAGKVIASIFYDIDPANPSARCVVDYDANGEATTFSDLCLVTRNYYDIQGRPYQTIQNLYGVSIQVDICPAYNPASPDRNVPASTPVYDAQGRTIASTDPLGRVTRTYFDKWGRSFLSVRNLRDPQNLDATLGELLALETPPGYSDADPERADWNISTQTFYDAEGRVIGNLDAQRNLTRTYFDTLGRAYKTTRNLTDGTSSVEALLALTEPLPFDPQFPDRNLTTETIYDAAGRAIATVSLALEGCVLTRHADGSVTASPACIVNRTYYDALGRSYAIVRNLQGQAITEPNLPTNTDANPNNDLTAGANLISHTIYNAAEQAIASIGPDPECEVQRDQGGAVLAIGAACTVDRTYYDGLGRVETLVRNLAGQSYSLETPPARETPAPQPPYYQHPDQNVRTDTFYNAAGQQAETIDPNGVRTHFGYDAQGRLTDVYENYKPPYVPGSDENVHTVYTYDAIGNRRTIQSARSVQEGTLDVTTFTYDKLGRQLSESDPLGNTWRYGYDILGQRVSQWDADNLETKLYYDDLGRLERIDYPAPDADVSFTYGPTEQRKTMTDGLGTTTWKPDAIGQITEITDPFNQKVAYRYDGQGRRTKLIYPGGKEVQYDYNNLHRLQTVTDWQNRETSYAYYASGQVQLVTLPNGVTSRYDYDDLGRLRSLEHKQQEELLSSFVYAYNPAGSRIQAIESVFTFEEEGFPSYLPLVCGECGELDAYPAPPESGQIGLDGFGAEQNAYPAPGEEGIDTLGPESGNMDGGDSSGYPAPEETPEPETSTGIWDQLVQFFQKLFQTPSVSAAPVMASFDEAWWVSDAALRAQASAATTTQPMMTGGLETVQIDYDYDPLYRLTSAVYSNGTSFGYTYDAAGNRLSETVSGGVTTTYEYDIANRLTSVNGVTYTWDDNGNLLSDGVNTYTYDRANRLTSVTGAGMTASYQYNGLGDRVRETVNDVTTHFTMDLNTGLTQVLADGTNTYLYGTSRIGQFTDSDSAYYLGDALGSVRQLTDVDGAVTMVKSYEPYGEVFNMEGSGNSDYGFTNEYTSQDLIYLRARWYSPLDGRFLTKDSWQGDYFNPSSYNSWVYGYANPIRYTDPSGYSPQGPIDFFKCFSIVAIGGPAEWLVTAEEAVNICRNAYNKELWNLASGNALPTNTFELWSWYLNENGDEHLYFDGNQILTRELAKSLSIHDIRLEFYKHGDQNKTLYKANVPEVLGGLIFDIRNSWISVNLPITFFLGSYWYQVRELPNGRVGFRIDNDTTLESGTHFAGRFPDQGFQGSIEDLIDQKPEIGNEPLSKVLNEYPVISILRSQTRSETNGALGGGTMFQTFTWTEKQNECFTQLYPWQILESVLDIQVWNDFQAYTDDIFIP